MKDETLAFVMLENYDEKPSGASFPACAEQNGRFVLRLQAMAPGGGP